MLPAPDSEEARALVALGENTATFIKLTMDGKVKKMDVAGEFFLANDAGAIALQKMGIESSPLTRKNQLRMQEKFLLGGNTHMVYSDSIRAALHTDSSADALPFKELLKCMQLLTPRPGGFRSR